MDSAKDFSTPSPKDSSLLMCLGPPGPPGRRQWPTRRIVWKSIDVWEGLPEGFHFIGSCSSDINENDNKGYHLRTVFIPPPQTFWPMQVLTRVYEKTSYLIHRRDVSHSKYRIKYKKPPFFKKSQRSSMNWNQLQWISSPFKTQTFPSEDHKTHPVVGVMVYHFCETILETVRFMSSPTLWLPPPLTSTEYLLHHDHPTSGLYWCRVPLRGGGQNRLKCRGRVCFHRLWLDWRSLQER